MITMREYRINGNVFVQAPALLEYGKKVYNSHGFAESYGLVYNMFPGITNGIVARILNGEIPTYSRGNTEIYFLEEGDPQE